MIPIEDRSFECDQTERGDDRFRSVCPNCGAALDEIRGKLQCPRCHLICETCCEGGRG